ncbi:type II secretion system protein N [Thorsellia anophelis]|uniref:Type II secretion system protein N n=1 Tax=Thorsellia anophelis DSM 18579 TaxID=1123402 RepID=A0A1I0AVY7_9GAMM|nr:type II secretion system protein N [Thorsellia anophelis]SES98146.1 Type II secretion system (T2SS), protein N [Thorsellia anophelis DSM 18579]
MKKKIAIGLFIVFFYLFFLILLMPARILISFVPLPDDIELQHINGSIWQGEVINALVLGQPIESIKWRLVWFEPHFSSIKPMVALTIQAEKGISMQGNVNLQRPVKMNDVRLESDLAALHRRIKSFIEMNAHRFPKNAPAIKQFNTLPLKIEGNMIMNIESASAEFAQCHTLNGNIALTQLKVDAFGINVNLNEASTPVTCQDNQLILNMNQLSDEIKMNLLTKLDIKTGQYSVEGQIEPQLQMPTRLRVLIGQLPGTESLKTIQASGKL